MEFISACKPLGFWELHLYSSMRNAVFLLAELRSFVQGHSRVVAQ